MSFSIARTLSKPLSRMFAHSRTLQTSSKKCQSHILQKSRALISSERGFARSLWYMSKGNTHNIPKTCGCCSLHTEGDKEFSEFLASEIKYEQENEKTPGKLPQVDGFAVTKAEGSEVTLSRTNDGETITVRFNVNHSVDDESLYDEAPSGQSQEQEPQMVSKPTFVVQINKGGDETLNIQCAYPPPDAMPQEGEDGAAYEDAIEITEITITKSGEDWGEKNYIVSGTNMDGNMYDMLLNMLEERGVDGKFTEQLVEFSTAYEHKQYINLLSQMHSFTSK